MQGAEGHTGRWRTALVVALLVALAGGGGPARAAAPAEAPDPMVGSWVGLAGTDAAGIWIDVAKTARGYDITLLSTVAKGDGCSYVPGDMIIRMLPWDGQQPDPPLVAWLTYQLYVGRPPLPGGRGGRADGCAVVTAPLSQYIVTGGITRTLDGIETLTFDVAFSPLGTGRMTWWPRFLRGAPGAAPPMPATRTLLTVPSTTTTPTTPVTPAPAGLRIALVSARVTGGRRLEVRYRAGTATGLSTRETFTLQRGGRVIARVTTTAGMGVWGTVYRVVFTFSRRLPAGPLRLCGWSTGSGGGRAGPSCLALR